MAMNYSKDDHFKWGWNDGAYNEPIEGGTFYTSIGSTKRKILSFRQECINTVTDLANQFTKPIRVGLSGGSDSQVACLALREAKIPFEPVIMNLRGPRGGIRNEHDTKAAFEFCKAYNLTPVIEDLDLLRFYQSRIFDMCKSNCFTNAHVLPQLHLVEKFKNTHAFIMAGGDPLLTYSPELSKCIISFGPTPIQQWLIRNEIEGCTKLFMYSPELILSYLDHHVIKAFRNSYETIYDGYTGLTTKPNWQCFSLFIKPMMYLEQWPELLIQRKYTGFEQSTDITSDGFAISRVATMKYKPGENRALIDVEDLVNHLKTGNGQSKTWLPTKIESEV